MTSITRRSGNYVITINDFADLIIKSPKVTQLFIEAATHVVTEIISGSVREIIVTIDVTIQPCRAGGCRRNDG